MYKYSLVYPPLQLYFALALTIIIHSRVFIEQLRYQLISVSIHIYQHQKEEKISTV